MASFSKVLVGLFQLLAAAIFFVAGWGKIAGNDVDVFIMDAIGLGNAGRNLIGFIELFSAILLLLPRVAHYGALLGLGTMVGAIIAHLSVLGAVVQDDGGAHIVLLVIVIISCLAVLIHRRRELPLLGIIYAEHDRKR